MTAENWEQVKGIVEHCLQLEAGERDAYVAEACAGNMEIADEVRSLVASSSEAADFLETPVIDQVACEGLPAGQEIGPYGIVDLIGDGGMGSVYRAARASDFQQKVAIKVVKRGMDTEFILERFRQERQILATLDHPNIARLLDGGATGDGRPYIVMELVEGRPITEYAASHGLTNAEKLRLFQTVCSAVQHAHQNLVIHRDLKASNILVTADGVPKLLDFGIAKLLETDTMHTATSVRMMTPECASPEQVRGEPFSTLTDVYSLGVLLYELMTGSKPYQFATRESAEIQRVICEQEPTRPGAVRPLPDDLDNIILKAMDKDPLRRYVSAAQLAEDIGRHLAGLPVMARSSTFRYRAGKFVRRHMAATFAAVAIVVSLAAGLGTALWQARVARMQRERAERRFADTHQLANALLFEIHDAIKDLPGSTPARKLIVDRALKYLDRMSRDENRDPSLEEDLAAAYIKIGDVQGGANYANLGDTTGAMASYRRALKIRQALAAAHPADLSAPRRLSEVHKRIASQNIWFGNIMEAANNVRQSLAIDQAIVADPRHSVGDQKRLSVDYDLIGDLLTGDGATGSLDDDRGALENHRKALEIFSAKPEDTSSRARLASAQEELKIAADLTRLGEWKEALQLFDLARPVLESQAAPGNLGARTLLGILEGRTGNTLLLSGDPAAALIHYRKELQVWQSEVDKDPNNARPRVSMAGAFASVGFALIKSGRLIEGMENMNASERILRRELAVDKAAVMNRVMLATLQTWFAETYRIKGDLGQGVVRGSEAADIYRSLFKAEPRDAASRLNLAGSWNSLGSIWLQQGALDQARKAFQDALQLAEPSLQGGKSEAAKYVLADAYAGLGSIESRAGSLTEAQSWYRRSASVWQTIAHPGMLSPNGFPTPGPTRVRAELDRIDAALARLRPHH